jgi:hypothetical protein
MKFELEATLTSRPLREVEDFRENLGRLFTSNREHGSLFLLAVECKRNPLKLDPSTRLAFEDRRSLRLATFSPFLHHNISQHKTCAIST